MKRVLLSALFLATLGAGALLAAAPAAAQEADVITGRVVGSDGKPISGARVEAIQVESEISRSVLTNDQGRYLILFPDGTGNYVLRVTMLGRADVEQGVTREADEELLLANITMPTQAIPIEGIIVRAPLPIQGQAGQAGEVTTELPQELLDRLPLPDLDPSTLAQLTAGVVSTSVDSLTGRTGFSVAGMSELLNQVTLDGVIMGSDAVAVPELGVRRTQITTSTFDVSRGGFAGGQVALTTARGNNRGSGTLTYRLDSDALQLQSSPTTNAFTRYNLGGAWGGPFARNKLFYNTSFQLQRNVNHRFALADDDPLAAQRSGVSVDSIARFLDILEHGIGVLGPGQTGPYQQLSTDLRLQGRLDWNVVQRQGMAQTLSTRFNLSLNDQDSTRINTVDLGEHGGDQARNSSLASMNLTSRFGGRWTNQLNASFAKNWSETTPYVEMPQGQVLVTSDFLDGTRGTRSLNFGGNRSMPTEARSQDVQASNDLSFIVPFDNQLHRLKVGGSYQHQFSSNRSTDDLFGTFTFNSLADFDANRPERFERALTNRTTQTGRDNLGLYVGDTWRVSVPLEITAGLRWDRSRLDERPAYNPRIEELFGRRTDIEPAASGWTPRLGFNYRLNQQGESPRAISGGIGWFAGRAPTDLFSAAVRQTGLPGADQRLICLGPAAPFPDWGAYANDPSNVPSSCAPGTLPGSPLASRAATVTLVDPEQKLPSSLRLDVGYRMRFGSDLNGNVRYQYSRGSGLWQYRDLNLDTSTGFPLADEGRPFYGTPGAIVGRTGDASSVASRLHPEFGPVYDVTSAGRSTSHQVTATLNGMLTTKIWGSANYTLGWARDQGAGSFQQTTTGGDPNALEWGYGSNDRRHTINLDLSRPITPWFDLTVMSRVQSGTPFTPMVNGDVNGDGARNDRAFVFDPKASADTAVAAGMARLLGVVPSRVRDCLASQLGAIAARNSCRESWSQSLDMRAEVRPVLPTLERRVTVQVDARNVLTGLDQLVHGADGMHGWGEGQRYDGSLLDVRGFDPVRKAFAYSVNEGFGQARRGPNAFRNGFSLTISARVALGAQLTENRGFGEAAGFRGGLGGFGGGGGGGGRGGGPGGGLGGGFGGGFGGPGGPGEDAAAGGRAALAGLIQMFRGAAGPVDVDQVLSATLTNPVREIVALKESLYLTDEQTAALVGIGDSLQTRLDAHRAKLSQSLTGLASDAAAGPTPDLIQRLQAELRPELEQVAADVARGLNQTEEQLSPEQWQNIPAQVRRAGPAGGARAVRGALNAVGLLDRMLANPLPVLLELKGLDLTPDQVTRVQAVSAALQDKLDKRRADLGKRFDGLQGPEQARLLGELRPQLDAGRKDIQDALKDVEKILTKEQWQRVPAQVRDPFAGPGAGGPRGGGLGGGGAGGARRPGGI